MDYMKKSLVLGEIYAYVDPSTNVKVFQYDTHNRSISY